MDFSKIRYYDTIVGATMTNLIVSSVENGGLALDNFNPNHMDHIYLFEVAMMTSQIQGKLFYVNVGLFDYFKLKAKNWKRRQTFKKFSKSVDIKLTDAQKLLDAITEEMDLEDGVYEVIYNEYYKS